MLFRSECAATTTRGTRRRKHSRDRLQHLYTCASRPLFLIKDFRRNLDFLGTSLKHATVTSGSRLLKFMHTCPPPLNPRRPRRNVPYCLGSGCEATRSTVPSRLSYSQELLLLETITHNVPVRLLLSSSVEHDKTKHAPGSLLTARFVKNTESSSLAEARPIQCS